MALTEIPQRETVSRIKSDLKTFVGIRMRLRANIGRCKIIEKEGTLEETHPNLFVVRVDEKRDGSRLISYSYADVLTRTVEITNPRSGENLLPWLHSQD